MFAMIPCFTPIPPVTDIIIRGQNLKKKEKKERKKRSTLDRFATVVVRFAPLDFTVLGSHVLDLKRALGLRRRT
jgi:hypothetical protein